MSKNVTFFTFFLLLDGRGMTGSKIFSGGGGGIDPVHWLKMYESAVATTAESIEQSGQRTLNEMFFLILDNELVELFIEHI